MNHKAKVIQMKSKYNKYRKRKKVRNLKKQQILRQDLIWV